MQSRAPVEDQTEDSLPEEEKVLVNLIIQRVPATDVCLQQIFKHQKMTFEVAQHVKKGWSDREHPKGIVRQ